MTALTNPIAVRMALLFLCGAAAFGFGLIMIRRLRRNLSAENEAIKRTPLQEDGSPVQAYSTVIQQLKQQKHELTAQQMAERRKARASDTLSATILASLSSGVIFLTPAGLVRQANAAARTLLDFASPIGMDLAGLFRTAALRLPNASATAESSVQKVLAPALSGKGTVRGLLLNYVTPEGETRVLELTASPVLGEDASLMGTALVLNDKTDIERIRHDQRVRQEASAELALELRDSLAKIAGYARQLAVSKDAELGRQLADNVAQEAAQLDRTIGSFLGGTRAIATGLGN